MSGFKELNQSTQNTAVSLDDSIGGRTDDGLITECPPATQQIGGDDDEDSQQNELPTDVLARVRDILLQRGAHRERMIGAAAASSSFYCQPSFQSQASSSSWDDSYYQHQHQQHHDDHYDDTRELDFRFKPPPPTFQDKAHAVLQSWWGRVPKKLPKTVRQATILFFLVLGIGGGLFALMEHLDKTKTEDLMFVELPFGELRGRSLEYTDEFLGIPYAKPPQRFKPSVLWDEPFNDGYLATDVASPLCAQVNEGKMVGSEDCLYLNIYTPRGDAADAKPRPVMMFLHGGKYTEGGIGLYNGTDLAVENDVIVVMVAYRLGALGFLAHREMAADETSQRGNLGLMDQQLAIQWVRQHIHAFNGDADRITIFGQSAGAYATCLHSVLPANRGLFTTAIMESGGCIASPLELALQRGDKFTQATGCSSLACLESLPVYDLLRASQTLAADIYHYWQPTVDGFILPAPPSQLLQQATNVTMIMGYNQNDGSIFVKETPLGEEASDENYVAWIKGGMRDVEGLQGLIDAELEQVLQLYPPTNSTVGNHAQLAKLIGESHYTCPTLYAAKTLPLGKAFVYQFQHGQQGCAVAKAVGAYHGSELAYVFHEQPWGFCHEGFTHEEDALSNDIQTYWTTLAGTGVSPNRPPAALPEHEGDTKVDSIAVSQKHHNAPHQRQLREGRRIRSLEEKEEEDEKEEDKEGAGEEDEEVGEPHPHHHHHHHRHISHRHSGLHSLHHREPASVEAREQEGHSREIPPPIWEAYHEEGREALQVMILDVSAAERGIDRPTTEGEGGKVAAATGRVGSFTILGTEGGKFRDIFIQMGPSEREAVCHFWDTTAVYVG